MEQELYQEISRILAGDHSYPMSALGLEVSVCVRSRARLLKQVDELMVELRSVLEALEGSFPSGDESVGLGEFKEVSLSEAWARRCRARAVFRRLNNGNVY